MVEPPAATMMSGPLVRVFFPVAAARRNEPFKLTYKVDIPLELDMGEFTAKEGQITLCTAGLLPRCVFASCGLSSRYCTLLFTSDAAFPYVAPPLSAYCIFLQTNRCTTCRGSCTTKIPGRPRHTVIISRVSVRKATPGAATVTRTSGRSESDRWSQKTLRFCRTLAASDPSVLVVRRACPTPDTLGRDIFRFEVFQSVLEWRNDMIPVRSPVCIFFPTWGLGFPPACNASFFSYNRRFPCLT